MFTTLTFHNLRCFKDFTLENITPLTLLSGRNNVGKTTVLEGVYLLLAYRNADVLLNVVKGIRGMEFSAAMPHGLEVWGTLFRNMDMTRKLSIAMGNDAGEMRRLTLEDDATSSFIPFVEHGSQPPFVPNAGADILHFLYECGSCPAEKGMFFPTQNGLVRSFSSPLHAPTVPYICYIAPNAGVSQQDVAENLGKIEQKNNKSQLVAVLQYLCSEIEDVFIVPRQGMNSIAVRLCDKRSLPLRAMGDGINKLLAYLSMMIAHPGGLFLLDEIETGFHYSFYPKLWELIARVAKETNSQVFATTHSYECIKASLEGVSKVEPSLLTYVRLGKEDTGIVPYSFAGDDLAYAIEHEMEIR